MAETFFTNGEITVAVNHINKLRTSKTPKDLFNHVPGEPISSLDEETLYNEIGFEMYRRK